VNTAISEMDHATQQNAQLVEESAAAAEALREQAQALDQVVSVFRLGTADAIRAAAPVVQAPSARKAPAAHLASKTAALGRPSKAAARLPG
jgi:hypothetical protein